MLNGPKIHSIHYLESGGASNVHEASRKLTAWELVNDNMRTSIRVKAMYSVPLKSVTNLSRVKLPRKGFIFADML